jgi:hypothetical protein
MTTKKRQQEQGHGKSKSYDNGKSNGNGNGIVADGVYVFPPIAKCAMDGAPG